VTTPAPAPEPRAAAAAKRARAERRGRLGESLAALWLQLKGYEVLASRVRTHVGEFDLAARRGRVLAIVEVKTRARAADGLDAVPVGAQRRIARAAEVWLTARPALRDLDLRFDLVIIAPWSPPVHLRDAWRPDARL
jgi:putative endonuclease